MELIKEIYQTDIGLYPEEREVRYGVRKAARAIVVDEAGRIALLYVSKKKYHKLPGGGVEAGEDLRVALHREVMEEVGVEIEVLHEIGLVIEYREGFGLLQISYCYYAKTIGESLNPSYTEQEKADGFTLKWVRIDEALQIMEDDQPLNTVGRFIQKRDLEFLKKAQEFLVIHV